MIRPRRGGKTAEMIRLCAEQGGYIVCADARHAQEVFRRSREMSLNIPYPITAREWHGGDYYPRGTARLWFDDLDRIIAGLSKVPVGGVTWTEEGADCV